jgi:hypothetical protein
LFVFPSISSDDILRFKVVIPRLHPSWKLIHDWMSTCTSKESLTLKLYLVGWKVSCWYRLAFEHRQLLKNFCTIFSEAGEHSVKISGWIKKPDVQDNLIWQWALDYDTLNWSIEWNWWIVGLDLSPKNGSSAEKSSIACSIVENLWWFFVCKCMESRQLDPVRVLNGLQTERECLPSRNALIAARSHFGEYFNASTP